MKPALLEEIELCLDMHYLTEIVGTHRMDPALGEGLSYTIARGRLRYGGSLTVRPMIQVLAAGSGSCLPMQQLPCADCGDFSRSWNCEAHTYWSSIGDADDPRVRGQRDEMFRTAFPDGPVMRNIQAAMAESAGRLPAELMPRTVDSAGAQPLGFGIHEEMYASMERITELVRPVVPRERVRRWGREDGVRVRLNGVIEQFGLDDE